MPSRRMVFHLARILLAGAAVWAAGWFAGYPELAILLALAVFIGWHAFNLARLDNWLSNPEQKSPDSTGIWAGIFDRIGKMEVENTIQNDQYQSVIGDFETLTNALPDATLVVDGRNRITWFNSAARALLNLEGNKIVGRSVTDLLRNPAFASWLEEQDRRTSRLEMTAPRNDDIWLDVKAVSIRENQRLIIFRDVSEVHKVDQIRRDFVTNISHELRTPLTVMLGYLEVFRDQPKAKTKDAIKRMHKQAVQMKSMIDDFLELSRLQSLETGDEEDRVDVAAMLLQLREQAEEISRGEHEIHFDVDTGLRISGISSDLESAFRNLIVNALKYTPEGGTISVSWQDEAQGPTLKVCDTGIGIPSREIPRLTERFYRVGSDRGRKSGGTGLGLAIVKHVMHAHQARLEISSDYGVGSQFSCIFPPERKTA